MYCEDEWWSYYTFLPVALTLIWEKSQDTPKGDRLFNSFLLLNTWSIKNTRFFLRLWHCPNWTQNRDTSFCHKQYLCIKYGHLVFPYFANNQWWFCKVSKTSEIGWGQGGQLKAPSCSAGTKPLVGVKPQMLQIVSAGPN